MAPKQKVVGDISTTYPLIPKSGAISLYRTEPRTFVCSLMCNAVEHPRNGQVINIARRHGVLLYMDVWACCQVQFVQGEFAKSHSHGVLLLGPYTGPAS